MLWEGNFLCRWGGDEFPALVKLADSALYQAKNAGCNGFSIAAL
jgi:GGDEF domain-containing protein